MSDKSKLSELQRNILKSLSDIEPQWTLVGGAALIHKNLSQRTTKDLNLYWREAVDLQLLTKDIRTALEHDGFSAEIIQRSVNFGRLRISKGNAVLTLDVIVDLTPPSEPDEETTLDGVKIKTAGKHEIFVNKLCSLLGRSEIRDLLDVKALIQAGLDLKSALADAAKQDAGFSPLTLVWVLKNLEIMRLGEFSGMSEKEIKELDEFRDNLIRRILRISHPA